MNRARGAPLAALRARRGLTLAALFGALAATCSVGLLATSAWLISRAAQRPLILYLIAPAAVVQAFGFGRAVLQVRGKTGRARRRPAPARSIPPGPAYDALTRLAPAGLADYRSGDLLTRLVADIDSLADRWLRVRLPFIAAAVAGTGAVVLCTALLPAAGLILAATLVVAALAAPAVAITIARRAEREIVPRRGELAATTMELVAGAGELAAFGAAGRALGTVAEKEKAVTAATVRSGYAKGQGRRWECSRPARRCAALCFSVSPRCGRARWRGCCSRSWC